MLTSTVAAGGRSLAADGHVVELLAFGTLRGHEPSPVHLNCDFDVTEAVQLQYFVALRDVV
jgi:hypothetical protein